MPANALDRLRNIRVRCTTCGEYATRTVEWCLEHKNLPCESCGGFIDLATEEIRSIVSDKVKLRDTLRFRR